MHCKGCPEIFQKMEYPIWGGPSRGSPHRSLPGGRPPPPPPAPLDGGTGLPFRLRCWDPEIPGEKAPGNRIEKGVVPSKIMKRDPSDTEDLRKIEEFLAGDGHAFEFLFEKYREKVYGIAYRFVHDKEDALEVTQEVFLRVHQGLSSFKTDAKFFTWLYRIAVNRAIDFARSRRTRKAIEMDAVDAEGTALAEKLPNPGSEDPADLAVRKELAGKVLEAVQALSPKHRTVFVLHAMEDLSYREIADVARCSIGTVMSRLFYARKKLQQMLGDYDRGAAGGRDRSRQGRSGQPGPYDRTVAS